MAKLQINGQTIEVDDSFLQLSPADQEKAVESIWNDLQAGKSMPDHLVAKKPFSVLPLSEDPNGNVSFDSDAGLLGGIKRAFSLPGEVMAGKVDPMSPEGIDRTVEMGATFSPGGVATRANPIASGAYKKRRPKPPTHQELLEEGANQIRQLDEAGVEYSTDGVRRMAQMAENELDTAGMSDRIAPNVRGVLRDLQNPPPDATVPIRGLRQARSELGNIGAASPGGPESVAASRARAVIDQFLSGSGDFDRGGRAGDVVAGNPEIVAALLKKGNANYAAGKRSEALNRKREATDLQTDAANSGANLGNNLRRKAGSILTKPKERYGYSPEEIEALRAVNKGSLYANQMRNLSNRLGGGGGVGQTVTSGLAGTGAGHFLGDPLVGGAIGLGVGVAGGVTRDLANKATAKAFTKADELVRMRSPMWKERLAKGPVMAPAIPSRQALVKALLMQQLEQQRARELDTGGYL